MSLGGVTGIHDRLCALVLAGYCGVTALLWKPFWKPGDFWSNADGRGRALLWDFLKNFALAGRLLLITFRTDARSTLSFSSTRCRHRTPYAVQPGAPP